MTYGPVAEDLRHALAEVMREPWPEQAVVEQWSETRVQFYDAGMPRTEEPENLLDAVVRYRACVLRAASALARTGATTTGSALAAKLQPLHAGVPLPSTDQLGRHHPVAVVDAWRRAALAATIISERELPALRDLSGEMRMVLGRDGAQLAVALLRLDGRYARVEGWRTIADRLSVVDARALVTAAEVARGWPAHDSIAHAEGLAVDRLGHDVPQQLAQPPLSAVIDNVAASNHVLRGIQPGVAVLRSITKGHEVLSTGLAKRAWADGMRLSAEDLTQRAGVYRLIAADLANVRSGAYTDDFQAGTLARGHVMLATTTLPHVPPAPHGDLTRLTAALHDADQILSATILQGVRTGWFFETGDEVGWYQRGPLKASFNRWQVMTPAGHPELVDRLKELAGLLGSRHYALSPDPAAAHDRAWFVAELERTSIPVPPNSPDLPPSHPRAQIREVLTAHYDAAAPAVRIVRAQDIGPAFAALVRSGALRVVHDDAAVPAALPITPAVRAAALADKIPTGGVLAGRTAAWVHTGLPIHGKLQFAARPWCKRPVPDPSRDTWETWTGTEAVTTIGGVLVTTPAQTAVEAALHLPETEAHRILLALATSGVDLKAADRRMDARSRLARRAQAHAVFAKAIEAIQSADPTPARRVHALPALYTARPDSRSIHR